MTLPDAPQSSGGPQPVCVTLGDGYTEEIRGAAQANAEHACPRLDGNRGGGQSVSEHRHIDGSHAGAARTRIAVVTGASSGIGEATARLLAARGWRCVLVARREDRLRLLAEQLDGEAEACDVADRDAVEATAARVLARHPEVHLVVNNAGIAARRTLDEVDLDLLEQVGRVNYLGGVWVTRSFLPGLQLAARADRSHIVNVVSIAGAVAFAPSGAYTAAKHAQLAFSRSLHATLRGSGIEVHTILPGYVQTEGFPQRSLLEDRLLRRIVVQPERVAETIVKAIERGRSEVVVPWFPYRPAIVLYGIAPVLVSRLGARVVRTSRAFQAKAAEPSPSDG